MTSQQDDIPDDKIYGGHNFSAKRRELTLDKVWHRRTWGEIFRHFLTALLISALPTFFDMFTDAFSAKSFINGKNYTKFVTNCLTRPSTRTASMLVATPRSNQRRRSSTRRSSVLRPTSFGEESLCC